MTSLFIRHLARHLAEICVNHALVRAERLKRPGSDYRALSHYDHLLSNPLDERKVVFDDDDGRPRVDKPLDSHRHTFTEYRVHPSHRLIEDHELGLGHT